MSNVPEGAQLSEDGQYWWDGSEWQLVEGGEGGGGGDHLEAEYPEGGRGGGEGEGGDGEAGFDFAGNGLVIDPVSMGTPSEGEELKAGFYVINSGTAAGSCVVTVYVDGQDVGVTWDSPWLEPGQGAAPDGDGYVPGIPGQAEGTHDFEVSADPPGQDGGRTGNYGLSVGAPE